MGSIHPNHYSSLVMIMPPLFAASVLMPMVVVMMVVPLLLRLRVRAHNHFAGVTVSVGGVQAGAEGVASSASVDAVQGLLSVGGSGTGVRGGPAIGDGRCAGAAAAAAATALWWRDGREGG